MLSKIWVQALIYMGYLQRNQEKFVGNPGFGNQSVKWYTGGENNENKKINNEVFVNNP